MQSCQTASAENMGQHPAKEEVAVLGRLFQWEEREVQGGQTMYSIVPIKLFVRISSVMFPLAKPKSVTFTWPSESRRTFSCKPTSVRTTNEPCSKHHHSCVHIDCSMVSNYYHYCKPSRQNSTTSNQFTSSPLTKTQEMRMSLLPNPLLQELLVRTLN